MKIDPDSKRKITLSLPVLSYKRKINIKGNSFTLYKINNKLSLESPIFRLSIEKIEMSLKESSPTLSFIPLKVIYDLSFLNKLVHGINVRTTYYLSDDAEILSYSTKIIFFSHNNKNKIYHIDNTLYFDYKNNFFDRDELVYDILNSLYNMDIQPRIPIDEDTLKLLEILII